VTKILSDKKNLVSEQDQVWSLIYPRRSSLEKLKQRSIRRRSWFKLLSWQQRRFVNLVLKVVDEIRSRLLLKALSPIVGKMLSALGVESSEGALSLMDKAAYRIMKGVSERIACISEKWGNKSARRWLDDKFIKYLIVMNLPQNRNLPTHTF